MSLFFAETGDALSRFDAKRVQGIGNAIGLGIEFGEARLASFEFVNNRVTERLRACADHVGKVRPLRKSGHVSPVVIFLLSGVWRHPAAKTIRGYIRCRLNTSSRERFCVISSRQPPQVEITAAAMNGGIMRRHSVDAVLQCGG